MKKYMWQRKIKLMLLFMILCITSGIYDTDSSSDSIDEEVHMVNINLIETTGTSGKIYLYVIILVFLMIYFVHKISLSLIYR